MKIQIKKMGIETGFSMLFGDELHWEDGGYLQNTCGMGWVYYFLFYGWLVFGDPRVINK